MNLYQAFSDVWQNNNYWDHVALKASDGLVWTYKDLEIKSAKLADIFLRHGTREGDRILICTKKSPFSLLLHLACFRLGLIAVPVLPESSVNELTYFIENSEPYIVIADDKNITDLEAIKNNLNINFKIMRFDRAHAQKIIEESKNIPAAPLFPKSDEKTVALLIYTSGTTGKPKAAMLTHSALYESAKGLNQVWEITAADHLIHALPFFHVHGVCFATHTILLAGGTLHWFNEFNEENIVAALPQATIFMGVPTHYYRLLKHADLTPRLCHNMRLFISGSAPLQKQMTIDFFEKTGHHIIERYGMTETAIIASQLIKQKNELGSVGKPLPWVELKIVHAVDKEITDSTVGEVHLKSSTLFSGYWKNAEQTEAVFSKDGFFKTGDLGYFDAKNNLFLVGRARDVIITGGMNVYPLEIELTLNAMPEIETSAVFGVPHPEYGEAVVAIVVSKTEKELVADALIAKLKQQHAGYKIPKKIIFASEIPKNAMGKTQKNMLSRQYATLFNV